MEMSLLLSTQPNSNQSSWENLFTQVKSQQVKGELLAKTIGKSGEKSRVYFEIRKNKKKTFCK